MGPARPFPCGREAQPAFARPYLGNPARKYIGHCARVGFASRSLVNPYINFCMFWAGTVMPPEKPNYALKLRSIGTSIDQRMIELWQRQVKLAPLVHNDVAG